MADGEVEDGIAAAIQKDLPDGVILTKFSICFEVMEPEGRGLRHRSASGSDGTGALMIWDAIGLLESSLVCAKQQLVESTVDPDDDEPE